jgi:ParB family chromosome partitioning protein
MSKQIENITAGNVKSAMGAAGAKSADLWMVPLADIRVMDNFNVRVHNKAYESHIEELKASILANGFLRDRALSGFVAKEGSENIIYVVDGHSRLEAVKRAVAEGAEITTLPVITKPAGTSAEDLLVGLVVSNSGKPLSPMEKAAVAKRLTGFGLDEKTIAGRFGVTAGYIKDLLMLMGAPKKIRDLVEDGKVSAANAVAAMKKHGDGAAEYLEDAAEEVAETGGRITKKTMKAKTNKVLEAGIAFLIENEVGKNGRALLAHVAGVTLEEVEAALTTAEEALEAEEA